MTSTVGASDGAFISPGWTLSHGFPRPRVQWYKVNMAMGKQFRSPFLQEGLHVGDAEPCRSHRVRTRQMRDRQRNG